VTEIYDKDNLLFFIVRCTICEL